MKNEVLLVAFLVPQRGNDHDEYGKEDIIQFLFSMKCSSATWCISLHKKWLKIWVSDRYDIYNCVMRDEERDFEKQIWLSVTKVIDSFYCEFWKLHKLDKLCHMWNVKMPYVLCEIWKCLMCYVKNYVLY